MRMGSVVFQFTHPVWGATAGVVAFDGHGGFQFTHPVWGATRGWTRGTADGRVSIHAPRVGCDISLPSRGDASQPFQFTHPVWGATSLSGACGSPHCFNSRTPCGVRPLLSRSACGSLPVSIHAPRVGCDSACVRSSLRSPSFNSRTPCGVRPTFQKSKRKWIEVSIHAPRVGCDGFCKTGTIRERVSIHAPRVGCDTSRGDVSPVEYMFQFTHPVWGATPPAFARHCAHLVSIHAPRVGCDSCEVRKSIRLPAFQFTHPVWGATEPIRAGVVLSVVSIHAPRVGCDCPSHR